MKKIKVVTGTKGLTCVCVCVCVCVYVHQGCPGSSDGKESTFNAGDPGDMGSIPGLGRSPGGGNGNPLQYSCLENLHGQRPAG